MLKNPCNKIIPVKLREHLKEILKIKKSPHSIALGFALGSFIAILPTFGFAVLIGIVLTFVYTKVNKFALFGSMALWNPLITVLLYPIGYKIGDFLFYDMPVTKINLTFMDTIYRYSLRFLIGNFILAISLSVMSYFIIKFIAIKFNEKGR